MQSGISASRELSSKFNQLQSSSTHFGLLANISNESLQPLDFLTPSSPSSSSGSGFSTNLSLLTPHLKPDEALYIILRRYPDTPAFIAVTYVPDGAPVRQKMLFASTRLTLVRELGTEHFRETIFANSAAELSAEGFQKHDAHAAIEAPLTEEERELGAVKQAEMEAGLGTVGRKAIHLGSQMSMPIAEDALASLKAFANADAHVVMLKIKPDTETIVLAPDAPTATPSGITALVSSISTDEPRFTFFRFTHNYNDAQESPVLFIYTCPTSANRSIKDRMMYPLMKRALLTMAEDECGVKVEKKFEVDDPNEMTEQTVMDDLHPKTSSRSAFARPKRPGRPGR